MKLENNDKLIEVLLAGEENDIVLSTSKENVSDLTLMMLESLWKNLYGVRGIKLQNNYRIISASILNSVDISTDEREDYLKYASALRKMRQKIDLKR